MVDDKEIFSTELRFGAQLYQAILNDDHASAQLVLENARSSGLAANRLTVIGVPAIRVAAEYGALQVCSKLVDFGVDVNTRYGKQKLSLLHLAVASESEKYLDAAIELGVEADLKDVAGESAIHWAAKKNDIEKINKLIRYGVDLNGVDDHGRTPMHYAAASGNKAAVEMLIAGGASLSAVDRNGFRPIDLSQSRGFDGVTFILSMEHPGSSHENDRKQRGQGHERN